MLRKVVALIISLVVYQLSLLAHGSWQQHAEDMYQVFGFEKNEELTNWMRFVNSVLIDNNNADFAFDESGKAFNFYSHLQEKYPGFQCKHRLLFHWGYNSRPWTTYLEEKVKNYGWSDKMIRDFQSDLIAEQKRRNGYANEYTENVFGYGHEGKDARIARIFISIAYDVHLLGDYEPDNTDLDGLQDIGSVIGDVVNNLNTLDKKRCSDLVKMLKNASQKQDVDIQKKASISLNLLKANFRNLLLESDEGKVAEHLAAKGIRFENKAYTTPSVEEDAVLPKKTYKKEKKNHYSNSGGIGVIIVISLAALVLLCALLFKNHK